MCDSLKEPYVSVIKINGVPILPPLITPELRKELSIYKQQAMKLEQRLKTCRDLRQNLDELLNKPASALNECDKPPSVQSKSLNLTKDLIEVTQYNGCGVKTICSNVQLNDSPRVDEKFKYETWTRPGRCKSESRKADTVSLEQKSNTPRLIRSNSYTLDTPSPVLLEHLKNKSQLPVSQKPVQVEVSPTIEVYQTDISVQQITLNSSVPGKADGKSQIFFARNPFEVMEPDSELMTVLKEIPDEYAQQVLELLKKQHLEQKNRLERYDSIKQNHNDDLIDLESDQDNKPLRRSSTFSISPSQSLYYSIHSDSDTITPNFKPDITSNGLKDREIGVLQENNAYLGVVVCEQQKNINRELFQNLDPITIKEMNMNKAASIIGAHVRGYLTRRLLNTEKVQNIIATVKDVLLCAVELHRSEIIDEKDIELHRRLINQLSAALYSFHEIFFDLSVQDRMAIISADRQRKLEKLKRPQSGRKSARPT